MAGFTSSRIRWSTSVGIASALATISIGSPEGSVTVFSE